MTTQHRSQQAIGKTPTQQSSREPSAGQAGQQSILPSQTMCALCRTHDQDKTSVCMSSTDAGSSKPHLQKTTCRRREACAGTQHMPQCMATRAAAQHAQYVCMHHVQSACRPAGQLRAAVVLRQDAIACGTCATQLHAVHLCACMDSPPTHQYSLSSAGQNAWLKYTCRTKPKQGAGPNLPAPPAVSKSKSCEGMHM